jgi:gamma-glutamylcyclotransferase (GGCT)/AIG2-like uncharacterized protein YtfP
MRTEHDVMCECNHTACTYRRLRVNNRICLCMFFYHNSCPYQPAMLPQHKRVHITPYNLQHFNIPYLDMIKYTFTPASDEVLDRMFAYGEQAAALYLETEAARSDSSTNSSSTTVTIGSSA